MSSPYEDYTTGTVSITNGSTSLSGSGTAWKTAALKAGDTFWQGGYALIIASVDDEDAITLKDAWPGTSLVDAAYLIRFQPDGSRMQGTTRQLLDTLREGFSLVGSSTTSLAIGTGSKTFTVDVSNHGWGIGARLRASSDADGANFMEGLVTAYADNSLTLAVDLTGGSGTFADWTINLAGEPWISDLSFDPSLITQYVPTPPSEIWRVDTSRTGTPRTFTLSAISGTTLTLSSGAGLIFSTYMAGRAAVRIWNTTKSPAESAWVTAYISSTQVQVTDADDIAGWSNGDTIQLGDPNPTDANTLGMIAIDVSGYLQTYLGDVFPQKGLLLGVYVSSTNGPSAIDFSGTGATGTAFGGNALSNGTRNQMTTPVVTTTLSPISNSNLLFVREQLSGGATDLLIAFARIMGVYV